MLMPEIIFLANSGSHRSRLAGRIIDKREKKVAVSGPGDRNSSGLYPFLQVLSLF
jgi:hypothetical protein